MCIGSCSFVYIEHSVIYPMSAAILQNSPLLNSYGKVYDFVGSTARHAREHGRVLGRARHGTSSDCQFVGFSSGDVRFLCWHDVLNRNHVGQTEHGTSRFN